MLVFTQDPTNKAAFGCRYVSSASLETLGQAFKDASVLMERNYDIFYEELKLSCYQPEVEQPAQLAYSL